MSASDVVTVTPRNLLYPLAAVVGVLLGVFLLMGAHGHAFAVWPRLIEAQTDLAQRLALLLPGGVLLSSGVANVIAGRGLWRGRRGCLRWALGVNGLAVAYLAYLMARGIPGHPVGLFLALASAYAMILAALAAGLRWPIDRR